MAGESQQVPTNTPDPTVLTTEQLLREVSGVRDLFESQISDAQRLLETRIESERRICDGKLDSVNKQLALIAEQRVEQKKDTKDAVDAALTAQKEAVREQTSASEKAINKSEEITKTQLTQLGDNFGTQITGLTTALADLKERIGSIEARKAGSVDQVGDRRATNAQLIAAVGLIVAILTVVVVIVNILTSR